MDKIGRYQLTLDFLHVAGSLLDFQAAILYADCCPELGLLSGFRATVRVELPFRDEVFDSLSSTVGACCFLGREGLGLGSERLVRTGGDDALAGVDRANSVIIVYGTALRVAEIVII